MHAMSGLNKRFRSVMWAVGRLLVDDKHYAPGLGTLEPIFVSSSINTYKASLFPSL